MEPIYSRTVPPCNYIRTSDFSLSDLSIYVDSMETLSRIERERHERRQRRRNNKLKIKSVVEVHPAPRTINNNEDSSEEEQHQTKPCPISKQQLRMKLFGSNTKLSSMMVASSSDENYFSGASESSEGKNDQHQQQQQQQPKTNFMDSNDGIATLPPDSGTESESGNFKLRPRSFAMTNPKYRSTRARIIGLVLKREYANGGSLDELEQQERRERVLEGLLRDKKNKTKNTKKCESLRLPKDTTISQRTLLPCKIQKQPSAEMRFIDKALRYLTL
ncbi:uncharacterized protein LOC129938352 [Eupeodes corollae]|uniref:uncharacterized protein LOC129938352 n=1 Tax=Eupeodes corollae TaxID=290404 RepID=UPI0024910170|nr:uncharacterized protein LOC129938352 [Eupeodes corollae]